MQNKKTKRKAAQKPAPKNLSNPVTEMPPAEPAPAEAEKKHGCLKALIVVIVLLIIMWGVLSTLWMFFGPGMLAVLTEKLFHSLPGANEYRLPEQSQISGVISGDLTANVQIPTGTSQSNVSLTPLPKTQWPQDAKGGMYQLEPSGAKFEKPLVMSINIKSDPGQRFSLGYWHPDTKKWEWIPTIKRSGNTYEGRLEHASEIGAYLPDWTDLSEYDYKLTDKNQRDTFWQYQQQLRLLSGEADINGYYDSSQARWLPIKNLLGQLTDSVIQACEKDQSPSRQRDFYFIWGVVQWNSFIGLDELLNKFYGAESRCAYEDRSGTFKTNYIIEQIDKYPYEVNVYNIAKSHGQQKSVYWGLPMNPAPPGSQGWQTDWKVYADTTTDALTDVNIQMAPGSQAGIAVAGTSVARILMMFSLKDIQVGEKFPITVKSAGSYTINSNTEYPKLLYSDKEGNVRFDNRYVEEYADEYQKHYGESITRGTEVKQGEIQNVATISGILLQDVGKDGARIKMQYEGLGPFQDAMENIKKTYEGTEFYNIFFQKGNLDISMDIPPIIIKPSDQFTSSPIEPPNTPQNYAPYN